MLISGAIFLLFPLGGFAQTSWQLVWSDEFDGLPDSTPDPAKWTYDLGNNGWGNQELENYTSLPENVHMDGQGNLVIHVESTPAGYTSARLKTQGLFAVQYGRIEARIKLPSGKGIWPAFWMLGSSIQNVGWPECGEIDIMENIGSEPSINHGSMHGPGYSGGNAVTATYDLLHGQKFSDSYHTFAVQWSSQAVVFYVDGTSYQTVTPSSLPAGRQWVFNTPFFLLLNVAVGGIFPGYPDATTPFPQDMLVDYVRVYQASTAAAPTISTGGIVDAASFGPALASGGLASIFGIGLAETSTANPFDPGTGAFETVFNGTSVFVNGAQAPLTYVSPGQINFQIPWETLTSTRINIEVARANVLSNPIPITLSQSAPSIFGTNGIALLTCSDGSPRVGGVCTLWGNGFGPTNRPQQNGVPSPANPPVITATPCTLTVGGVAATVSYCGLSPGLIIYQVDFIYPSGGQVSGSTVEGAITVNGKTGIFRLAAPL